MSHADDFQKLIDAVWAERDQGRGVRRALAEHPDLWPLVVELGLEGYAEEAEREVAEGCAQQVPERVPEDDDRDQSDQGNQGDHADCEHDACAVAPALAMRGLGISRRSAQVKPPGFKPSRARRMFAGSVVNRPGVVAWSGRAAID